jgi:hypothetical protein
VNQSLGTLIGLALTKQNLKIVAGKDLGNCIIVEAWSLTAIMI